MYVETGTEWLNEWETAQLRTALAVKRVGGEHWEVLKDHF